MSAKDQWIQKTMESLDELPKAEPNPYLYEKITNRLQSRRGAVISVRVIWKLSVGFAILLLLNVFAISKYRSQHSTRQDVATSGDQYGYQFNYNY